MANFPKMTLTNAGILALTKVQSGKTLAFKRIALGDGQLSGAPISPLTALISQKATVDVSNGKILGENTYQVGALFKNTSIAAGFWWREVGAIIYDPDDSTKEVLLCYSNAGDAGDYIPPSTDQRIEKYVYVSMSIANAGSVTITIPASDSYLLATEKGAPGGVAVLDKDGKLPSNQIPTGGIVPANHASTHATGGSDPITAEQIGAAKANHSHTPAQIGAATKADITAAVSALQSSINNHSSMTLLKTVTTSARANRVNVNISGIDWGSYNFVIAEFEPEGYGDGVVNLNNESSRYSMLGGRSGYGISEASFGGHGFLNFFVFKNPNAPATCINLYSGMGYGSGGPQYKDITTMNFSGSLDRYYLDAGTVIRFWGVN